MLDTAKLSPNTSLYHRQIEPIDQDTQKPAEVAKRDEHAADPEVASLYYLSTLQTMKEVAQPTFAQTKQIVDQTAKKKTERGIIQTVKDWLWGCLGFATNEPAEVEPSFQSVENVQPLNNPPSLSIPDHLDHKLIDKAIREINEHLERLKDTDQFEEEMRKSNSKKLDKLILVRLTSQSLLQRDLKRTDSIRAQQELHHLRKKNEEIQKKTGSISEDLTYGKEIANSLKWINVSLSGSLVLGTALAFFTGGTSAMIAVAMPLAAVLKGGTTLTDGIVKFNNGKKEGELSLYRENSRANTAIMHDELEVMQVRDDEIASVLKSLRKILKDQSENERAIARFGK
jgi:hypothetical protein